MTATLTTTDLADAGRLLGWAARPKERPARQGDYDRLVARYLDDDGFAATCDAVASGAGLNLTVSRDVGVIAVAEADSPLRMPIAEFRKRTAATERRALPGVALLAIARVAFPQPVHLDDPLRVARVTVAAVTDYLNRLAGTLAEQAEDPDADHPELAELWRSWEDLRHGRHDAQRASSQDRRGLVRKVCRFLEDEGMLSPVSDDDGGTWRANPRFRAAVADLVEDSDVFAALLTFADDHSPEESP